MHDLGPKHAKDIRAGRVVHAPDHPVSLQRLCIGCDLFANYGRFRLRRIVAPRLLRAR